MTAGQCQGMGQVTSRETLVPRRAGNSARASTDVSCSRRRLSKRWTLRDGWGQMRAGSSREFEGVDWFACDHQDLRSVV
jgi:hypothetical protein